MRVFRCPKQALFPLADFPLVHPLKPAEFTSSPSVSSCSSHFSPLPPPPPPSTLLPLPPCADDIRRCIAEAERRCDVARSAAAHPPARMFSCPAVRRRFVCVHLPTIVCQSHLCSSLIKGADLFIQRGNYRPAWVPSAPSSSRPSSFFYPLFALLSLQAQHSHSNISLGEHEFSCNKQQARISEPACVQTICVSRVRCPMPPFSRAEPSSSELLRPLPVMPASASTPACPTYSSPRPSSASPPDAALSCTMSLPLTVRTLALALPSPHAAARRTAFETLQFVARRWARALGLPSGLPEDDATRMGAPPAAVVVPPVFAGHLAHGHLANEADPIDELAVTGQPHIDVLLRRLLTMTRPDCATWCRNAGPLSPASNALATMPYVTKPLIA